MQRNVQLEKKDCWVGSENKKEAKKWLLVWLTETCMWDKAAGCGVKLWRHGVKRHT